MDKSKIKVIFMCLVDEAKFYSQWEAVGTDSMYFSTTGTTSTLEAILNSREKQTSDGVDAR